MVRPGGTALVVGPLPPAGRLARLVADAWMLFPSESEYREWFSAAGFDEIGALRLGAPWDSGPANGAYALAIAGRATAEGPPPSAPTPSERVDEPWTARRLLRFAAGALAGAAFIPLGVALNLRARRAAGR